MQYIEVNNKDHNYSEVKLDNLQHSANITQNVCDDDAKVTKSCRSGLTLNKETFGQIKDINELKKITPRVKLLTHDANSLNELTKISLHNKVSAQKRISILEQTKQELKKYCRTCAGLKLPLVDIFSEKGNQMRLSQQIKHLEEISPYDSLSTQMCMDCICDLKMSYKFFMQIKKAEVKLKSILITLTDATTRSTEANKLQPIESSEKHRGNNMECNATNLSLNKENNERACVPKISAIFSLKNEQEFLKVEKADSTEESENKTDHEIFENIVQQNSDDNESIEEFDPDDPPFQPDSSDAADSDDEVNIQTQNIKKSNTQQKENMKQCSQPVFISDSNSLTDKSPDLHQTTYNYDTFLRAYIKVEDTESNNLSTEAHGIIKSEATCNESAKECLKQPNILKRRLLLQNKREFIEETDENVCQSNISDKIGSHEDFKVQKLNVNNSLNINSNQEDGIMYVTVKGSKPNEILLVKVKKMDKPLEKKEDKYVAKKSFDIKPMEKILKRYETLATKEKDLFPERTKKFEIRGQIIEEQIEEYKKKREKVLGGHANISLPVKLEESQTRYFKRNENQDNQKSFTHIETDSVVNIQFEKDSDCNTNVKVENDISEIVESVKEKPTNEKTYVNTEEYLSRLAKLKLKWEEVKKKKEFLQKELDESYTEGNIEKLARILGEKEKNLQDFQDYLKQRKIVITRLKDEDIISLYEDRNNAVLKNSLPDLIDESQPADYIPEEHYLECDYCPETFASKDVLEEHLKMHDYKIMHFCEDCMEEFPTNKAKRNHNVICIKKLLCKYCDMMLDSKGKKRQHEQKHCDSLYGQLCDICGEKFKHQGTLDQHVKTQHMSWEKIYQCPKCPKKFAFKQKLSFHLKSVHTTLRAYLCEDCGADFKNPASLRHHRIRKHQPVGNKRECPVCHKLVPFYSLSKHMHTHKAYTIECPHCDKMFKNSSTLKQHVRIHEDQRQYRCDTCGVGFNRRDGLRLHMRVHEKTDSRGLKECSCQVCGEKFPNHSMLVIHRNRVHKDGRQYTCHICNRSMISTRSLEWHMSHIHNESLPGVIKEDMDGPPEKKRASCYHCNKTFKTEMILRTHIKNTHMEKDPMKCLDCELTFTSEVRLRHHMMVTHNRLEGTLPCPHCPKRFVNQLRLKTHMISHSEERPYTCEICGFNLKTKIQLIKHHQNRHSDERPLQCRYCPWRCKQVSALVCHERTHTNERPYSCSVCRQRFKYLGDKNKHERRHESLGGSGFKRIVLGRNIKAKVQEDSSCSEHEQEGLTNTEPQVSEGQYQEQTDQQFEEQIVKFEEQEIVKFEEQEIAEEYEQVYEQEYEETSREASDAAEVIMNMEDTVYTEEVAADNIEPAEIMTDEMMTNEILQSGAVVHLQQEDDSGKIQVIPVMLSLPDLSDANTEVNLATASIMYNN
ncbi:Zinc finger protein 62 [Anthophora retusa]